MQTKRKAFRKIMRLRKMTDAICKKHPQAERSHVYQTLLLLQKPPWERLKLALTRGH